MTPDAAPAAPPVAGAEPDCELHVTSVPDGATVRTGQLRLGQTPLDIPLPCGRHELSIRRPRYADVDRTITLTRGTPGTALVHLERPDYTLRVDATPRAMVTIDGKSAGLSPVTATVHGHTPVDVSVSLAGYAPWSKQVKLSKNMRLDARLELLKPGGKPKKP
jgi:hypothetical protein